MKEFIKDAYQLTTEEIKTVQGAVDFDLNKNPKQLTEGEQNQLKKILDDMRGKTP